MKKIVVLCLLATMAAGSIVAAERRNDEKSASSQTQSTDKKLTTTVFLTSIDSCPSCSRKVMDNIPFEKGVKDLKIDVATKRITVTFDPAKTSNEKLIEAFAKLKIAAKVS